MIYVEVTLYPADPQETLLTKKNLLRVQEWIIQQGSRQTYCSRYNSTPFFETARFNYYLNPDPGQQNINCDLAKSGFHTLAVCAKDGGRIRDLEIQFLPNRPLVLSVSWPSEDLAVGQIRALALESVREILGAIPAAKQAAR